ncbi:MAG TPA: NmrA family NAD(P)-binding protein [Chitinophagaceae bacterium]|nr:NmrA family NAD(P)-binding protein [Chitinophagaceae bacterium]
MPRVLIVGASGVLGHAAAEHFLQKGFTVRSMARNPLKAADLEQKGAQLIAGDLTDTSSLEHACKEVDIIIAAAHGMLGKGKNSSNRVDDRGHRHLIEIAGRSGVQQFIYSSVYGCSEDHPIDFLRTKFAIEKYLEDSGLNYTILRLAAFMEWHVHNLLGKKIIDQGKAAIFGTGDNPTNFIAVKDIVKALDKIVANPAYYKKIINLGGPENISRNDVAALYFKRLSISPRVSHVPLPLLKILSGLFRPFHPGIARIMKLSVYMDKANAVMNKSESIEQFGLAPTGVDEFIEEVCRKKVKASS